MAATGTAFGTGHRNFQDLGLGFLRKELALCPGHWLIGARTVFAATITIILIMRVALRKLQSAACT